MLRLGFSVVSDAERYPGGNGITSGSMNNDAHPFGDEEYMTVTLTTTHEPAVAIEASDWVEGGMPRQSYASPWSVASPKHAALVRRQGRLEESFVQTVVDAMKTYLEPPADTR